MIYIIFMHQDKSFSLYLPVNLEALKWEIHCNDAGFSFVPPGANYPLNPREHPKEYADTVVTGRVLAEFQAVYIVRGSGKFWAEQFGSCEIRPGDLMLLFPGVKHAYSPHKETGWDEYWVGFTGLHAHRLWKNGLFQPEHAVHHIGVQNELIADFEEMLLLCREQSPGFQIRLGALVLQLLSHIHAIEQKQKTDARDSDAVRKARQIMQNRIDFDLDMKQLAEQIGLSYTQLLETFRTYTGLTPYQYFLQLRIHHAKTLLQNPNLSIKEVSAKLRFENQYYFSRLFKKKTGLSPSEWRSSLKLTRNGDM